MNSIRHGANLWLCLLVAIVSVQQASSDQQSEVRDVASIINGGPLKPLSHIELSLTRGINLLAKKMGNPLASVRSLDDIDNCIQSADRLIEEYNEMFSQGKITKTRIDEKNSIERAATLLRALPAATQSCDLISYLDLVAIIKAAAGDSGKLELTDRVRSSVLLAMKLHRDHCSIGYNERLVQAFSKINAETLNKVNKFWNLSLIEQVFPGLSKDPLILIESKGTLETLMKITDILLDRLIERAPNFHSLVHDDKRVFNEILVPHLLNPCKSFIEPLEEVLLPAKVDMALKSTPMINSSQVFVNNWARFHICSAIHYNELSFVIALEQEISNRFNR